MTKKLIILIFLFCPIFAKAQYGNTFIRPSLGAPASTACSFNLFVNDTTNGNIYFCSNGTLRLLGFINGIVPVTSGGTGGSTSVTSPIVLSSGNFSCPTCTTGTDTRIIGGVIGTSIHASISSFNSGWFTSAQTTNLQFPAPFSFWLANETLYISGGAAATGTGPIQVGYQKYFAATNTTIPNTFSLPLNSIAGAYQSSFPLLQFISVGELTNPSVFTPGASYPGGFQNGISAQIVGINAQILGNNLNAGTIGISTTSYTGPSMSNSIAVATIPPVEVVIPYTSGAIQSNLGMYLSTANGAGGALTLCAVKNESASCLTESIAAPLSSIAGAYFFDTVHTDTFIQGDRIAWKLVNANGAAVSGAVEGVVSELAPTGNATGMIVFGSNGITFPAAGTTYGSAFTNYQNATELNARSAFPSATIAVNLACFVTTAPLVATEVITLMQNGNPTNIAVTSAVGGSVPRVDADYFASTGHSVSFSAKDTFSLRYTNGAGGTAAVISSCSLELAKVAE